MKKLFLLATMLLALTIGTNAQKPARVPAYPGMIERTQPDGYTLQTFLRGDEHKHWSMTTDGWQIIETKKGWYVYAKRNKKGEAVAGCKKAHNEADRTKCEKRWLEKKGIKLTAA